MTTVKVTWHQAKKGGQCDFCPRTPEGDVPYIDFAVTTRLTDGRELIQTGPWGLCPRCTILLGLKPGDDSVDEARARERHVRGIVEICLQQDMSLDVIKAMVKAMSWGPDPAPVARTPVHPGVYTRGDGMVEIEGAEVAEYMGLPETDDRVRERVLQLLEIWRDARD